MVPLTFGSLFAGIGGIDLGLERAGMECRWQVENNPFCIKVLKKHWPHVPRYKDIKDVRWLEPVDLIAGGFPCQPVSVAGQRKGIEDERWLWPEFERIIRMVRPRYVLVENVPGLLHRGMSDVFGGLARCGYDAEWQSIPAHSVGAPHRRDRVFIVAYTIGERWRGGDNENAQGQGRALQIEGPCSSNQQGFLAHPSSKGLEGAIGRTSEGEGFASEGENVADTKSKSDGRGRFTWGTPRRVSWFRTEPDLGRVANGIPSRVDRLRGLGNAVVPQVAEWIGRRIIEFHGT